MKTATQLRLLPALVSLIPLTWTGILPAAEESAWQVSVKQARKVATANTANGAMSVRADGIRGLSLGWKPRLPSLGGVSIRLFLRSGNMYHLYKLNELTDVLPLKATSVAADAKGDTLRITRQGEALGVKIVRELVVDAARREARMTLKLVGQDTGRRGRKYQFQCEARFRSSAGPQDLALVLPTPQGHEILRVDDPSGQEIYDQDHHKAFPRTIRLHGGYGRVASLKDHSSVLFSSDNLRYAKGWIKYRRPHDRYCYLYGADVRLKKGEEHAETWTFKLGGLGGLDARRPTEPGALLGKRYITAGDAAAIYVGCRDRAIQAFARLARDGKTLRTKSGEGDLTLDLSGLPDGDYTVVKDVNGAKGEETLTLLRKTWQGTDREVARIKSIVDRRSVSAAKDPDAARIRIALIRFKLAEVEAYKPRCELRQMRGLLKDARRALKALVGNEPARAPAKGKLIYANDMSRDTGDFMIYGNGKATFSRDKGMYLEPVGTMNLWSKFKLNGSYVINFDFFPCKAFKGGTMLQMCGESVNPVSQYSLMCSASWGSMAYYMFGTKCYHFSFVRFAGRSKAPRICNLRKTGKGFYLLSEIADPITDTEKWYHLTFVKNGTRFLFFVDGKLVQEYIDIGAQGPILESGRLGIRNWSTFRSHMKNLRVHRPAK